MTSLRTLAISVLIIGVPFAGWSQSPPVANAAHVKQVLDVYMRLPTPTERSPGETSQAAKLTTELESLDRISVSNIVLDRIANSTSGHDLVKYRYVLERVTPPLKSDFFVRASAETSASKLRRFIRLADAFWGREAARFLVSKLDDKRSAETNGDITPGALRICDIALNVLDRAAGKDLHVHIGFGTGYGGDTIVRDVPVERRDEWISTLKSALIAKYGDDLNVPDKK